MNSLVTKNIIKQVESYRKQKMAEKYMELMSKRMDFIDECESIIKSIENTKDFFRLEIEQMNKGTFTKERMLEDPVEKLKKYHPKEWSKVIKGWESD